jgi:hypothetical protein
MIKIPIHMGLNKECQGQHFGVDFVKNIECGDRIVVYHGNGRGHVCTPVSFRCNPEEELPYKIISQAGEGVLSCHEDSFDILHPPEYIPKSGDRIVITNKNSFAENFMDFGKIYIVEKVTEFYDKYIRVFSQNIPSINHVGWIRHESYETIKQTKIQTLEFCEDCRGTGKIMLFTSVVKCKCVLGRK